MTLSRPFDSVADVISYASLIWRKLPEPGLTRSFCGHPRIGDVDALRQKYATTAGFTSLEQAGVAGATDEVLQRLAAGNEAYERKHGFVFLVCATGKSAAEMLEILERRLPRETEIEIRQAAEEQERITEIRLRKLLGED